MSFIVILTNLFAMLFYEHISLKKKNLLEHDLKNFVNKGQKLFYHINID